MPFPGYENPRSPLDASEDADAAHDEEEYWKGPGNLNISSLRVDCGQYPFHVNEGEELNRQTVANDLTQVGFKKATSPCDV